MIDIDARAQAVLDFWFGRPGEPTYLQTRPEWFRKDPAFDATIRARFGPLIEDALQGRLDGWAATPQGALARIQAPRQRPRHPEGRGRHPTTFARRPWFCPAP